MTTIFDIIKTSVSSKVMEHLNLKEVIVALEFCDDLYHNGSGESPLTDAEYDQIKEYIKKLIPNDPYFSQVGSSVRGGKIPLPYPMGSLDQIYDGDYDKWVARHGLQDNAVVITDKLDGVSCLLTYGANGRLLVAYSRGDGKFGADITRHISKINALPKKINTNGEPVAIRAEVIISPANFSSIQDKVMSRSGRPYKNPRNFIAGFLNSSTNPIWVYEFVDVVAYQIVDGLNHKDKIAHLNWLNQEGFLTAHHWHAFAKSITDKKLTDYLILRRKDSSYQIDGIVIEVDEEDTRERINPTKDTLNPAYAVKFKVPDVNNTADVEVVNVDWNISKDGYLKPRIQFVPVDLCGVTISNATGFNAKFIQANNIGPGAIVRITRSGDVIPFCTEVVTPSVAQMPTVEASWNSTGVDLIVNNASDNTTVQFEQLNDFFATLDIPNLGEGNLQKIFDAGLIKPEDIIVLDEREISSLIGSSVIGKKIYNGMISKLTNIPLFKLMGAHPAFGRGVGVRKMKKLWEAFAGDMTKCADFTSIVAVAGFEEKTANKIVDGYDEFQNFMAKISDVVTIEPFRSPTEGSLAGMTFVFTGFRDKDLEMAVEAAGGKMGSAVSSKTTYLVTNDTTSTSGKTQKARSIGINVIGINELRDLL